MESDKIRTLTCCCCGAVTRGRQWHNRDTGFGLCSSCVDWIRGRGKTEPEEFTRRYGHEGVHFNVNEQSVYPDDSRIEHCRENG